MSSGVSRCSMRALVALSQLHCLVCPCRALVDDCSSLYFSTCQHNCTHLDEWDNIDEPLEACDNIITPVCCVGVDYLTRELEDMHHRSGTSVWNLVGSVETTRSHDL